MRQFIQNKQNKNQTQPANQHHFSDIYILPSPSDENLGIVEKSCKLKQVIVDNKTIQTFDTGQNRSMIFINKKKNPKLLQNFNNDPYYDTTIKTSTTVLHLILGYLSIDSIYFYRVESGQNQIDLSHLPEKPLIRVLRSLYGAELFACNVKELAELYEVIDFLEIDEYKKSIEENLLKNDELLNKLDLLQFALNKGILRYELKKHHIKNKLQALADNKNYLQLSKISKRNLNEILLEYSEATGNHGDKTINHVLENYFGANDISSSQYFLDIALEPLKIIWEKYHHPVNYIDQCKNTHEKIRQSQILLNTNPNEKYYQSLNHFNIGGVSMGNLGPVSQEIAEKDKQIAELERQLALKKQIIENLKKQISLTRDKSKNQDKKYQLNDAEQMSMLEGVKKSKKQRENIYSVDYEISMVEPAFDQARKIVNDQREVKTMNRLNSRSKKIFQ